MRSRIVRFPVRPWYRSQGGRHEIGLTRTSVSELPTLDETFFEIYCIYRI
jgi:hypothetical protein